jgi:hypothetical protein
MVGARIMRGKDPVYGTRFFSALAVADLKLKFITEANFAKQKKTQHRLFTALSRA